MNQNRGGRSLLALVLALLLVGLPGSAIYWSVSGSDAVLAIQEDYGEVITAAAGGASGAAMSGLENHWNRLNRATRLVETHAHLLFLCILLIFFAMLLADPSRDGRSSARFAWLATGGLLIYPAGLAAQAANLLFPGRVLSTLGAVLILLFAGHVVAGLFWPGNSRR